MKKNLILFTIMLLLAFATVSLSAAESKAEKLAEWVTAVNFFESGANITPYDQRVYRTHFVQSLSRYINWEVNFNLEPLGERLDYKIQAVWIKPDGSVMTKQKKEAYIEADWTAPWTAWGYGSKAGGSYDPGIYRVDFYVKGKKITSGSFEVMSDKEAGMVLPTLWKGTVPLYPGAGVLTADERKTTSTMNHALVEMPVDKESSFYFYRKRLKEMGWTVDKQTLAKKENGSLENKMVWGILNLTKENQTLTMIIPSDQKTGSKKTQVDFTLINRLSGAAIAEFVKKIPRVEVTDTQMNQRFEAAGWGITVLSARIEGNQIKKTQGFAPGRSYTFSTSTPGVYLLRVVIDLERLNGKPIESGFLVRAVIRDAQGQTHQCVGAGTDMGEYYEYQKGGSQSILQPVTSKDKIEYVFALPTSAAAMEFIWPGFNPIRLKVE